MPQDFAPLAQRLGLLHLVRVASVLAALFLAVFAPGQLAVEPINVVLVSLTYLVLTSAVEVVRRLRHASMWAVINVVILIDALYVLLIAAWSGETLSPMLPFALLHLVAITLLLSYRTGLKAALWYALVFCAFDALIATGDIAGLQGRRPTYQVALTIATFLLFTVFTAVFSAYNEGVLRRSRWYFRALANLALELEQQTTEAEICRAIALHTREQLGFERAVVLANVRRTAGALSTPSSIVLVETEQSLADDPIVAEAMTGTEPLLRRVMQIEHDSMLEDLLPNPTNLAVMPMRTSNNEIGGVIIAEWSDARGLPQATADALVHTANHGALALRNARLLAELERRAARDPLTGLGNRRSFDESLDRELSRCRRDGSSLSLVVFDLDHFKEINDEHGHQVGDQVLRSVSRLLTGGVRDMDVTSRYGGEEFVILFPGTSSRDAAMTADRLRVEVATRSEPVSVTISAGVATFPDLATSGAELMALADAALYEAKRSGRNRVVVAGRPHPRDDEPPLDLRQVPGMAASDGHGSGHATSDGEAPEHGAVDDLAATDGMGEGERTQA
jgi:diguanylate cyclase (GGDEF)-like protein